MRYTLAVMALGLLVCATFGCGSSEEGAPAAAAPTTSPDAAPGGDMSGMSPAGAGMGMAPMGGEAGAAGAPADPGMGMAAMPGDAGPGIPMPGMEGAGQVGMNPANAGAEPGVGGLPGDQLAMPGTAVPGGINYPGANDPGAGGTVGIDGQPAGGLPGEIGAAGTQGGIPGGPEGGAPPAPTTLDGFAKQAFRQGRDREAIQFLQGWALTSDAGASEVLSNVRWVSGLKRPVLAVRWGVGLQLTIPRGFTGDAKPIGSQQTFGTGGTRNRQGGQPGSADMGAAGGLGVGGYGAGGGGGGDAGGGVISTYAGDFGKAIIEQFQSRVSNGNFGTVLQDALSGGTSGAGELGGQAGYAAMPGAGGEQAGLIGVGGMPGAMPGAGAGGLDKGGVTSITTGLTLLGTGTEKDLMEKAVKERVDVLAVLRVKVTVNRAGLINNDSELVLFDPAKKKELFNSGSLNNIKVQKERELNKEDSVEKEVKKIFDFVDKNLIVSDLPSALTPDIVKTARVEKQLLVGSIEDPLSVLTEIHFYHRNKLLMDADAAAAMSKVAGEPTAKTLLEGSEEDRKKAIQKWLPRT